MLRWFAAASAAVSFSIVVIAAAPFALALEPPSTDAEAVGFERTPPRLAFTDGEVSFLRPGADGWAPARVNMPLAAGDELALADRANVELQIGPRAYLRAGGESDLGLTSLEPDFLQLRLTRGTAALDLRSVRPGHTFEIDTPNAAFTIERPGYYRIEVDESETAFSSRRGGRATAMPGAGPASEIAANEELVVTGVENATLATRPAPELDEWDRWNYARTDRSLDTESARYVPEDVYGSDDLDAHGSWRVVATYGPVWVPHVAVGWAPYTFGSWVYDPYYGWTWVDAAPWGWAPFHYGRWVRVDGYWAWSPGPRPVRVYYAPALVAFYGSWVSSSFSIGFGFGSSYIGWVALGWGEPLVPWWGPHGCRGTVRWAGWAGPRVVNEVEIHKTTTVNVTHIHRYAHAKGRDAVVTMNVAKFGREPVSGGRQGRERAARLEPVRDGDLRVEPAREAFAGGERSSRGPRSLSARREVVTRGDRDANAKRSAAPPASAHDDAPRDARARKPARETGSEHGSRGRTASPSPGSYRERGGGRDRTGDGSNAAPPSERGHGSRGRAAPSPPDSYRERGGGRDRTGDGSNVAPPSEREHRSERAGPRRAPREGRQAGSGEPSSSSHATGSRDGSSPNGQFGSKHGRGASKRWR